MAESGKPFRSRTVLGKNVLWKSQNHEIDFVTQDSFIEVLSKLINFPT